MKSKMETEKRHVVPRWRDSADSQPIRQKRRPPPLDEPLDRRDVEEREAEWREEPSLGRAADFVSTAISANRTTRARDAALQLLKDRTIARDSPLARLAQLCVPGGSDELKLVDGGNQVSRLRRNLRVYARDAVSRVDLARQYTALGHRSRASRELTAAIQLEPRSRFVIRAAARFLVHVGEPDKARWLLAGSGMLLADPWLLAADVAISQIIGRDAPNAQKGRKMLRAEDFDPQDLSELASALGSLELSSGDVVQARKLLRQSLKRPTDNSIAQAEWASRTALPDITIEDQRDCPQCFEARAKLFYREGRWHDSLEECFRWSDDEPFSSGPAELGTFVAILVDEIKRAKTLADRGHVASPDDASLRNNLAYAEARLGDTKRARALVTGIDLQKEDDTTQAALVATTGLIYFRERNVAKGRAYYGAAIEIAEAKKLSLSAAFARGNLAREEFLAVGPEPRWAEAYSSFREAAGKLSASQAVVVQPLVDQLEVLWFRRSSVGLARFKHIQGAKP